MKTCCKCKENINKLLDHSYNLGLAEGVVDFIRLARLINSHKQTYEYYINKIEEIKKTNISQWL